MVAVKRRTRETLTAAILRYILPGSHIMSDGWAAYAHIPGMTFHFDVPVMRNNIYIHLSCCLLKTKK